MTSTPACPESLTLQTDPITAVDLALYAAASGDLNPLHLDADVARAAGFDRPIAQGMRTMACAGRLFTRHFGPTAMRSLETRFTGSARLGDVLQLSATLTEVVDRIAHYALVVRTSHGDSIASGRASVALSA